MRTHDEQKTCAGHERKADALRDAHGQHDPVHLCFGNGGRFYPWTVGQGGGQRRNLQNDFTSIQHPNWRDDWVPEWNQTEPRRHR